MYCGGCAKNGNIDEKFFILFLILEFLCCFIANRNRYFCKVKKLCIYLLVFTMLCESNTLTEMLKAPFLIEHFVEHHNENASIGVLRFISMHYLGHDIKDNDADKDMKLPFKKMSIHSHLLLFQLSVKKHDLYKQSYRNIAASNYLARVIKDPMRQGLYKPPRLV